MQQLVSPRSVNEITYTAGAQLRADLECQKAIWYAWGGILGQGLGNLDNFEKWCLVYTSIELFAAYIFMYNAQSSKPVGIWLSTDLLQESKLTANMKLYEQ